MEALRFGPRWIPAALLLLAIAYGPARIFSAAPDLYAVEDLLRPLSINMVIALAALALAAVLFRSVAHAALFATGCLLVWQLWRFAVRAGGWISPQHAEAAAALLSFALIGGGAIVTGRISRRLASAAGAALAAVLVFQVGTPTMQYAADRLFVAGRAAQAHQPAIRTRASGDLPDIYHILLDGYARADVLESLFGLDNSAFLDPLRRRGFAVAERSTANFNQTLMSMASMLSMDHLDDLFAQPADNREFRMRVSKRLRESAVLSTLRRAGYRIEATTTLYNPISLKSGPPPPPRPLCAVRHLEDAYFARTPAGLICRMLGHSPGEGYRFAFRGAMAHPAVQSGPPTFQFRHVFSPHPPFILDASGGEIELPASDWRFEDADQFIGGSTERREAYRRGYAGQVQGLNRHVLALIDRLLQNPRPKIIILHGDHGSGMLTGKRRQGTCGWERYSNLLAVFASDGRLQRKVADDLSLVNVYRLIFNTYFGSDLPLLEAEHYFTSFDEQAREAIAVTQPCALPAAADGS